MFFEEDVWYNSQHFLKGHNMLNGIIRESIGKKATKAARRDGYLVANIYGKGLENIDAAFKSNEYIRTVKTKKLLHLILK